MTLDEDPLLRHGRTFPYTRSINFEHVASDRFADSSCSIHRGYRRLSRYRGLRLVSFSVDVASARMF